MNRSGSGTGELGKEVATSDAPAVSPSGKYRLAVRVESSDLGQAQTFEILDQASGTIVYEPAERFLMKDTTFFLWDAGDRVWVYSGDVGTYFWENQGEPDRWEKRVYAQSDVPAPPFLKQVRPRWHQR